MNCTCEFCDCTATISTGTVCENCVNKLRDQYKEDKGEELNVFFVRV